MKKVISVFLLIALTLLCCVSCDDITTQILNSFGTEQSSTANTEQSSTANTEQSSTANTGKSSTETNNERYHKEVELDLSNFTTYLSFKTSNKLENGVIYQNYMHTITGVLSYAYYEDVVVTFDSGKSVTLNAAGCAEIESYGEFAAKNVKKVSGKVIFTL